MRSRGLQRPASAPPGLTPETKKEGPSAEYDAFISYSHAVDGRLAPALQTGLHRFAKPWYRLTALRVFRDETSLSATPELWLSIVQALDRSGWFILLASPEAARSNWVNDEVSYWCGTKSKKQIMVVVSKDDREGDFDWGTSNAIPPSLRQALSQEPRVVDVRWTRAEADVSLQNARFRDAVADLAAPLHGLSKDQIHGEDVRQHQRTRRLAWGGVAVLIGLLLIAVAFAGCASVQSARATRERDRAISRSLATQALARLEDDVDLAAVLGLEAFGLNPTVDARSALLATLPRLERRRGVVTDLGPVHGVAFGPSGELFQVNDDFLMAREARTWFGAWDAFDVQPGPITHVAVDPGGSLLASGGAGGSVFLWKLKAPFVATRGLPRKNPYADPNRTSSLPPHQVLLKGRGRVRGLAFSARRSLLAAATTGRVHLWQLVGPRHWTIGAPGVSAMAISNDGKALAVAAGRGVQLWDPVERRRLGSPLQTDAARVTSVAFTPDGRTLAAGGADGRIRLWDVVRRARPRVLSGHSGAVTTMAFAPVGSMLASGGADSSVRLWHRRTGLPFAEALTGHDGPVESVAFSPRGTLLASAATDALRLWDTTARRTMSHRLNVPGGRVTAVAYRPDGKALATAGHDGAVRLWDPATRASLGELPVAGRSPVTALTYARRGSTLAVGHRDGSVVLQRGTRPPQLLQPQSRSRRSGARISSIAFDAEGERLVAIEWDGFATQFDVASGQPVEDGYYDQGESYEGESPEVAGIAFSPDGRLFATAMAFYLPVQATDAGIADFVQPGSENQVDNLNAVAFSPDSNVLATGGEDRTVRLWDVSDEDVADAFALPALGGPLTGHAGAVTSVAFSPDGRTLASGSADRTVRLWDVASRRPLGGPLRGHAAAVTSVAFGHTGRSLASADAKGVVRLWDPILWSDDPKALQQAVCRSVEDIWVEAEDLLADLPHGRQLACP